MRSAAMLVYLLHLQPCAALQLALERGQPVRPAIKLCRGGRPKAEADAQREVQQARLIRRAGLGTGGALLACGAGASVAAGMVDADALLGSAFAISVAAASAWGVFSLSFDEHRLPCDPGAVAVGDSAPGMGRGLFAAVELSEGTYLFDYEGEQLSEAEMFSRYPDGKGRYVACVGETMYIDGANEELSGVARYINHSQRRANVWWKKQRFGPGSPAMHFYALRDVKAGEELFFDYGDVYWDAMGVQPVD